jgi:hypothetical protein
MNGLPIQIKTPLTFSDNIQPVSLPIRDQETESGITATVVGWGRSSVLF